MQAAVVEAELRAARLPAVIGICIMVAVLAFVVTAIRPLADPAWPIDLWVAAMATVLLAMAGLILRSLHAATSEVTAFGVRAASLLQSAMSALIMISFWILMPAAGPELQPLMLMMYVWYIATVVAASSAPVPMPARDIILLTASAVLWVAWERPAYWQAWAVFLGLAGVTMLAFRRLIRAAVVAAHQARLASEAAEKVTREALATAEAARDAKTRFIAAASHDLQQPLHAASLFFDLALDLPDGIERRQAIAGAHAAFQSSQALIAAMLDHMRLEADAVSARLESVEVDALLARVALEQDAAARAAGMMIRRGPSRLWVTADAEMLRRALSNLVVNAIRHSRGEHVLLAATPAEWVDAVCGLLNDPGRCQSLGAAGRRYVERYHHWEHCLEPLIQKILEPARTFEFWADDAEFYRLGAKTPRSNCVLDVSKLLATGVTLRPVEEALTDSLQHWTINTP